MAVYMYTLVHDIQAVNVRLKLIEKNKGFLQINCKIFIYDI